MGKLTIYRDESHLVTVKYTQSLHVQKLWEDYWMMEGPAARLLAVASQVDVNGVDSDAESKL